MTRTYEAPPWRRKLDVGLLGLAVSIITSTGQAQTPNSEPTNGAQAFSTASAEWDGLSEFARLAQRKLGSKRVKLTAQLDYDELAPQDALLIIHPETQLDDDSLTAFLAAGGRLAVIDDFGESDSLLQRFGIRKVPPPLAPLQSLQGDADLPIATPVVQIVAGIERGRHPIAAHVDQVALNHPRALRHPDLTEVLEIRSDGGAGRPIAVTGIIAGQGRLLVMSDPSMFINLMLRYPGNRRLAEDSFDYLLERPQADARAGRLFLVVGDFDQVGRFGGDQSLLDEARDKLRAAGQTLEDIQDDGIPPWLALTIAALLAIWAVLSQLRDNLRLPAIPVPGFARLSPLVAQTGAAARAEVLSGPGTPPVLALIEMESALREASAQVLGVEPFTGREEMRRSLEKAGLGAPDAARLTQLLAELRELGQGLSAGRPRRPSRRELKRLHQEAMTAIGAINRAGGRH